jgi:hypothetical protein
MFLNVEEFAASIFEHVHTRPQPIFGLAVACADRVQAGMNMRGQAGPGGDQTL